MAHTVISLRASNINPVKLQEVLSGHLAYERARRLRTGVLPLLALMVAVIWAFGTVAHLVPIAVLEGVATSASIVSALVLALELLARRRFTRALKRRPLHNRSASPRRNDRLSLYDFFMPFRSITALA